MSRSQEFIVAFSSLLERFDAKINFEDIKSYRGGGHNEQQKRIDGALMTVSVGSSVVAKIRGSKIDKLSKLRVVKRDPSLS